MSNLARWLPFGEPDMRARLRLFCLPHAGGGAVFFRPWRRLLPDDLFLAPIELPGRGARIDEVSFTTMAPLVDALAAALAPVADAPFALFGHSMGAAIGYELAQRLPAAHLFVSARPAPDPDRAPRALHRLDDAGLLAAMARIGGTPASVLARQDLMAALLPAIRADLELIETYVPSGTVIDAPITAFGGAEDRMAERPALTAWGDFTRNRFRLRLFPGGHFFPADQAAALVTELKRDLGWP